MKNFIIVLFAFFCIQCSKDDNTIANTINCIGVADLPLGGIPICNNSGTMMYLCDVFNVGSYTFDPSSKKYMPLFCKNIGSNLIYRNHAGEEITFVLKDKLNKKYVTTYNTFQLCQFDSMRSIGYCIISDRVSYNFWAESIGLELEIILKTIPDIYSTKVGYIGDILEIRRKKDPSSYFVDFSSVVNQRSLSYAKTYNQEFYSSIEILGKTYQNVMSNDILHFSGPIYKYYYNNDIGLLAFRDTTGITWKLIE
jgi:hypothetical protein